MDRRPPRNLLVRTDRIGPERAPRSTATAALARTDDVAAIARSIAGIRWARVDCADHSSSITGHISPD